MLWKFSTQQEEDYYFVGDKFYLSCWTSALRTPLVQDQDKNVCVSDRQMSGVFCPAHI